MSEATYTRSFRVGGNILPASFVKQDPSTDYQVLQAGAGDRPLGVAQPGTRDAPGLTGASPYAGIDKDLSMMVAPPGKEPLLYAGTGGWSPGDFLRPDATGYGVVSSTREGAGALALSAVPAGAQGRVWVLEPAGPASSTMTTSATTATSTVLTARDAGKTITVGGTDATITLPAASLVPGQSFTFILGAAAIAGGALGTFIDVPAGTKVRGNGFTPADGKGVVCAQATDRDGDAITLRSDGADYVITAITGTWVRET